MFGSLQSALQIPSPLIPFDCFFQGSGSYILLSHGFGPADHNYLWGGNAFHFLETMGSLLLSLQLLLWLVRSGAKDKGQGQLCGREEPWVSECCQEAITLTSNWGSWQTLEVGKSQGNKICEFLLSSMLSHIGFTTFRPYFAMWDGCFYLCREAWGSESHMANACGTGVLTRPVILQS